MKGNRDVIRQLNKNLGLLLVTINQYFLHARILKNWGFEDLGKNFYKQSIVEMKAADEIISCDLAKEREKHAALVEAIAVCEEQQDYVSRQLLEKQKDENEERIDWLTTQQEQIESIGLQNYLQSGAQTD